MKAFLKTFTDTCYHKTVEVEFESLHFGTFPEIGETNWEEVHRLINLMTEGFRLSLKTKRTGKQLDEALIWCLNRRLRFRYINGKPC